MALRDIFKRKPTITAVEKEVNRKETDDVLDRQPRERIKESLADYANAIVNAENPLLPESLKYREWLDLCRNIELDEHISSLIDSITFDLIQMPFDIVNEKGDKVDERKALFERSWFSDLVRYWVKSQLYPFGAVNFTGFQGGSYTGVEWIDEYHVRPCSRGVAKYDFEESTMIDFDSPGDRNFMFLFEPAKHLGLFSVVAKLFIMKRDVRQFWAVYNELFTTPYYIVKTDFNNSKHRDNLLSFLSQRKHAGFGVISHEDEISQILTYTGTGYQSYRDFEDTMNKGMSKAMIGQTMTNEDGSSRSQSEVHERTKNSFINAYLTMFEYFINETLIPSMRVLGAPIMDGECYKYSREHTMTPLQWAEVVSKLTAYKVSDQDIMDKIGVEVEERQQQPAFAQAVYDKLKASYEQNNTGNNK